MKVVTSLYIESKIMARETSELPDQWDQEMLSIMSELASRQAPLIAGRPWYVELEFFDHSGRPQRKLRIEETPSGDGYFVVDLREPPASVEAKDLPGFWTAEQSGVLRPAVEAFLRGEHLTTHRIELMRAYLRQWIYAPAWAPGPELEALRETVGVITTERSLKIWLEKALEIGIDPL